MSKESHERNAWLALQGSAEVTLADKMRGFFRAQALRLARQIQQLGGITPSMAEALLDPVAEAAELRRRLADPLRRIMRVGAARVWVNRVKKWNGVELDDLVIPDSIKRAMESTLTELAEQPYWIDIQAGTQDSLTEIIRDGIDGGLNEWAIAKQVRATLTDLGKVRAHALARTEATLTLNAGHQSAFDGLFADGTMQRKMWLSVLDKDTRPEHSALNGVEVPIPDDFNVGGELAPYPGHWGLSAGQRINCRCTVIAVT